jgi:hypothetical protein
MSIQIIGSSKASIAEVDGTTYRALRVTARPADYGLVGQYKVSAVSGALATLATGSLYTFQWSDPIVVAVVWGITLDINSSTSQTGGIFFQAKASLVRSFTVSASNGTLLALPGSPPRNQQLRTSMNSTRVQEIRIANTAVVTDGTWILDANPFGCRTFSIQDTALGIVGNVVANNLLFGQLERRGACMVLAKNEGFTIKASTSAALNASLNIGVTTAWSEVAIF